MTRQPDFSTSPRASRTAAWDTLAVSVGAFILAVAVGGAWSTRREAQVARGHLAEVRRQVDAAQARVRTLEARARDGSRVRLPAAVALPAEIVAALARALPREARFEKLSIDYARGGALELHVVARDAAAWDLLLERLGRSPDFREVEPGPESREGEVRSVIRTRWARGKP